MTLNLWISNFHQMFLIILKQIIICSQYKINILKHFIIILGSIVHYIYFNVMLHLHQFHITFPSILYSNYFNIILHSIQFSHFKVSLINLQVWGFFKQHFKYKLTLQCKINIFSIHYSKNSIFSLLFEIHYKFLVVH